MIRLQACWNPKLPPSPCYCHYRYYYDCSNDNHSSCYSFSYALSCRRLPCLRQSPSRRRESIAAWSEIQKSNLRYPYVGYSQNCGPLLAIDYIIAPNVSGYQNATLILGTTHVHLISLHMCGGGQPSARGQELQGIYGPYPYTPYSTLLLEPCRTTLKSKKAFQGFRV